MFTFMFYIYILSMTKWLVWLDVWIRNTLQYRVITCSTNIKVWHEPFWLMSYIFLLYRVVFCHIYSKRAKHFVLHCFLSHSSTGWALCCSTLAIASIFLSLFSHIEHSSTAINTACAVPLADPPFAIALVLQPRDWDIFIPVLCTSQAPSIILLKSALSWKWEGRLRGGFSWWLFHGTVNLSTSFHSCCAPTLPNMTFCSVVYHFVLYGQQAHKHTKQGHIL